MVKSFGFSSEEAERHTRTGRSYLAIPLLRLGVVLGVLYFFTSEPQVFPRSANLNQLEKDAQAIVDLISVIGLT